MAKIRLSFVIPILLILLSFAYHPINGDNPTFKECKPHIEATIRNLAAKVVEDGEEPFDHKKPADKPCPTAQEPKVAHVEETPPVPPPVETPKVPPPPAAPQPKEKPSPHPHPVLEDEVHTEKKTVESVKPVPVVEPRYEEPKPIPQEAKPPTPPPKTQEPESASSDKPELSPLTQFGYFDKFINLIFDLNKVPERRSAKWATPWNTHDEFKKKMTEKAAKKAEQLSNKVDLTPGFISKFINRFVDTVFGSRVAPDAEREGRWSEPWQTHKEHIKKVKETKEPEKAKPEDNKPVFMNFRLTNYLVGLIFGRDSQTERDTKWSEPWTTHAEHKKKTPSSAPPAPPKPIAHETHSGGGIINSFVSLFFPVPKEYIRNPKWSEPWQTHKEHIKAPKAEKVTTETPAAKEAVVMTGKISNAINKLVYLFFAEDTFIRGEKWAQPWQTHPEHIKAAKKEPVVTAPIVKEVKTGGIFGLHFMNSFVGLLFGQDTKETKPRDSKWADPWQKHPEFARLAKQPPPSPQDTPTHSASPPPPPPPAKSTPPLASTPPPASTPAPIQPIEPKVQPAPSVKEEPVAAPVEKDAFPTDSEAKKTGKEKASEKRDIDKSEKKVDVKDKKIDHPKPPVEQPQVKKAKQEHAKEDDKKHGPKLDKSKLTKVDEKKTTKLDKSQPSKIDKAKPTKVDKIKPTKIDKVKTSKVDKIKPTKVDKTKQVKKADKIKTKDKKDERKSKIQEKKTQWDKKHERKQKKHDRDSKKSKRDDDRHKRHDHKKHQRTPQGKHEHHKKGTKSPIQTAPSADRVAPAPKAPVEQVLEKVAHEKAPKKDTIIEDEEQIVLVPSAIRPRDHIESILGLDETAVHASARTEPIADATLRDLKKVYETAIKPLELTYKYQDISNRHLSDAELFGTPLVLMLGPYSTGKSTFINYLLGIEFTKRALKTGTPPSHGVFRLVQYGEQDRDLDGTDLSGHWSYTSLQKFGQNFVDQLKGKSLNVPLLKKVTFVEAPGILEMRRPGERLYPFNDVVQWFIDRADLILVMFDYTKLDAGYELEAILDQLKGRESQTRILLNKADQVPPEELMKVQGSLFWNLSPLLGVSAPPVVYAGSFASIPYRTSSPVKLFQAQEQALLHDISKALNSRVDNRIAITRRHAVRVRNHAQMVDTYLTTFYKNKGFLTSKHKLAEEIVENPHAYNIYEGMSLLTNISRYDLPDAEVYRDFFRVHNLYDFRTLRETCSYLSGCPLEKIDAAISKQLPELMDRYRRLVEAASPGTKLPDHASLRSNQMGAGAVHAHSTTS